MNLLGPNDGPDFSGLSISQILGQVGKTIDAAFEHALHALEIQRIAQEPDIVSVPGTSIVVPATSIVTAQMASPKRGIVVPLTADQRLKRMLYLGQQIQLFALDDYVQKDHAPAICPDIYYLLKDHNGGKNPCAPDPADRWSEPGKTFVNRTCDCIGGQAWCGGWDRYQPIRFKHIYDGWINTDSMCMECDRVAKGLKASDPPACFRRLPYPVPGCYVVCRSGSPGHKIGHIGGVIEAPPGLDLSLRDNWRKIKVVDVASRTPNKANALTTAIGWAGTNAYFVEPCMAA